MPSLPAATTQRDPLAVTWSTASFRALDCCGPPSDRLMTRAPSSLAFRMPLTIELVSPEPSEPSTLTARTLVL
ncbi:hypothetical protein D3C72_2293730 [compost metagenome]